MQASSHSNPPRSNPIHSKPPRHYHADRPGSSPGTLAPRSDEPPRIQLFDYDAAGYEQVEQITPGAIAPYLDEHSVTWIDVQGLGHVPTLEAIGEIFQLHPLTLEDIANVPQRPKVEEHADHLLLITHLVRLDCSPPCMNEQISFILGPHYLLSIQEEPEHDCFEPVRSRIKSGNGRSRKMGADYLLYALLDSVIDSFFPVLETYGEQLELLEDEVVANPSRQTLAQIHRMKRELLALRRTIWPQRDAVNALIRDESDLISPEVRIYLRDCYDHTVQLLDIVEMYREVASNLMDVYLSSISNKMNEIMKFLTVMSSIFIPLTFIVGVYGMNFENMPELRTRSGYFICWAVMITIAIALVSFFWRKGWFENYSTQIELDKPQARRRRRR
jgi:magnesium transporter